MRNPFDTAMLAPHSVCMAWKFTADVEEYASQVLPLLVNDPVLHTAPLTVIANARARTTPLDLPELFAWWTTASGLVAGAASHTPPHDLLLAVVPPDAVHPLVHALKDLGRDINGVSGSAAAPFGAICAHELGCRAELDHVMRLHRLDALVAPSPIAEGTARTASMADRDLLLGWFEAFARDARLPAASGTTFASRAVDDRLSYGGLSIWEDESGQPVAMAGVSRPTVGVVRIGPVYTPLEQRARGYGTAVTHAVTATSLAAGATDVVLFTDVSNPTSNAIYQRLGFCAVSDIISLRFVD